jgi:hypothetical protein
MWKEQRRSGKPMPQAACRIIVNEPRGRGRDANPGRNVTAGSLLCFDRKGLLLSYKRDVEHRNTEISLSLWFAPQVIEGHAIG